MYSEIIPDTPSRLEHHRHISVKGRQLFMQAILSSNLSHFNKTLVNFVHMIEHLISFLSAAVRREMDSVGKISTIFGW